MGETARLIGGRVHVIESKQALRQHLASDSSDVSMVMVHKFQQREEVLSNAMSEALGTYRAIPAGNTFGVVNASERIVLMIEQPQVGFTASHYSSLARANAGDWGS